MSHLDYANSLFYGLPDCDIDKLQHVQNCAVKIGPQQVLSRIVELKHL